MAWKKIAEKGEVSSGKGKAFKINGKQIAVFNQDGFHAMDDLCVHQDGSIAPGKLEGDIVECPLHFWKYNIKTGQLVDYLKDVKLETYPVQSRDDGLYVDIKII
jgi:Ferredoxin subunits of nitrite reductase and ring-hydroxylating dioxygenases